MKKIIVGVDESGVGAWCGSSVTCAVAMNLSDEELLRRHGVTDSKKLSDHKRRALVPVIADTVHYANWVVISVEDRNTKGHMRSWHDAMVESTRGAVESLRQDGIEDSEMRVVIDGSMNAGLYRSLVKICGVRVEFRVRADAEVVAVGAASIVAKTVRNDLMLELHKEFPDYHWNENYGYGTAQHLKALNRWGRTKYHRDIKPLRGMPFRRDANQGIGLTQIASRTPPETLCDTST